MTFLTGFNGIFKVTSSSYMFYFKKTITNEDAFIKITQPTVAYEIESLNDEIKKIIIDEGHYTEANYPFTIKPNFSTLGPIIELSPQRPIISFMFDDSIRDLLGSMLKHYMKNILYLLILSTFYQLIIFF